MRKNQKGKSSKTCETCELYRRSPYHEDGRCLGCLRENTNVCETCKHGKVCTFYPSGNVFNCIRNYDPASGNKETIKTHYKSDTSYGKCEHYEEKVNDKP